MATTPAGSSPTQLGEVWPQLDARLRALLRARGEISEADDIVQEVAVRILQSRVAFSDAADLYPWAAVVARNLHVSRLRERARIVGGEPIPPQHAPDDVAESAHWRQVWTAALTHLTQMSDEDRRVLLDPLLDPDPASSTPEPGRVSVRRHRARASLRRRLRDVLAALLPIGGTWRLIRRQGVAVLGSATLSAALIVTAGIGGFDSAPRLLPGSAVAPAGHVDATVTPAHTGVTATHLAQRPVPPAVPRRAAPDSGDRHLTLQPGRAPGLRVDETHPQDARPLACLHGPVVEGLCTPPLPINNATSPGTAISGTQQR